MIPMSPSMAPPVSGILPANGMATPSMLDRRRKLAEAMMQEGMNTGPVGSWTQGAARMANAMVGGLAMNRADKQEFAGRKSASDALMAAMTGGKSDTTALLGAMNNPWMSPGAEGVIGTMMDRKLNPTVSWAMGGDGQEHAYDISGNPTGQTRQAAPNYIQMGDGTFINQNNIKPNMPNGGFDPYASQGAPPQPQVQGGAVPPQAPQTGAMPASPDMTQAQPVPQPMPPGASAAQLDYSKMTPVQVGRAIYGNMFNIHDAEQGKQIAALRNAAPGMGFGDLQSGEKFRTETTGDPAYTAFSSAMGSIQGMQAAAPGNDTASNAALLHNFAEVLAPGKIIKGPNGIIQFAPDVPENIQSAIKKYESYLTGEGYLTPGQKQEMLGAASAQVKSYQDQYKKLMTREGGVASNYGVHIDKVVPQISGYIPQDQNMQIPGGVPSTPLKQFNWTPEKGLH